MSKLHTALINHQHTQLLTSRNEEDGVIYVALKPIVEGMGLSWGSQRNKIMEDARYVVINTPYETLGGTQEMLSLSLDHLPAFLYSINPNRVRKDLRETIIAFQSETFAVINAYWRNPTLEADTKNHQKVISGYKGQIAKLSNKVNELKAQVPNEAVDYSLKVIELIEKGLKYDALMNKSFGFDGGGNPYTKHIKNLYKKGVIPAYTKRTTELTERIDKELGTVGEPYIKEILTLQRFFTEEPTQGGNFIALSDTLFPHGLLK